MLKNLLHNFIVGGKLIKKTMIKATTTTATPKHPPVVVILGATATGKSKLAVNLALKFNGEIISADSMQVYKELDILTNKITPEEMQGIPHHMLSIVDPTASASATINNSMEFDVHCYQTQALPIVDDILSRGKIPFIVGGTNYYIESLLWKILVHEPLIKSKSSASAPAAKLAKFTKDDDKSPSPSLISELFESKNGHVTSNELQPYESTELYETLFQIDPERCKKLHPNDRRKIIRSLQVYYQTGRRHSDVLNDQFSNDQDKSELHVGGSLRYPNSLCFWIQVQPDVLEERINHRVDEMVEKGLKGELEGYIEKLRTTNSKLDFTRGLLQSIGFKEFNSYLQLPPDSKEQREIHFEEGVELLKLHTRQYVKAQLKWINQRFLKQSRKELPPVYKVDGTKLSSEDWHQNVTIPTERILEAYLSGNGSKMEDPLIKEYLLSVTPYENDLITRTCESCGVSLMGNLQWDAHINGNKHKKRLRKRKLQEDYNISRSNSSISS